MEKRARAVLLQASLPMSSRRFVIVNTGVWVSFDTRQSSSFFYALEEHDWNMCLIQCQR